MRDAGDADTTAPFGAAARGDAQATARTERPSGNRLLIGRRRSSPMNKRLLLAILLLQAAVSATSAAQEAPPFETPQETVDFLMTAMFQDRNFPPGQDPITNREALIAADPALYEEAIAGYLRIPDTLDEWIKLQELQEARPRPVYYARAGHLATLLGRERAEPMLIDLFDRANRLYEQALPLYEEAKRDWLARGGWEKAGSVEDRTEVIKFSGLRSDATALMTCAIHAADTLESGVFVERILTVYQNARDGRIGDGWPKYAVKYGDDAAVVRLEPVMLDLTKDRDLRYDIAKALAPKLGFDATELLFEMVYEEARLHRRGLWPPTKPFRPHSMRPRESPVTPPPDLDPAQLSPEEAVSSILPPDWHSLPQHKFERLKGEFAAHPERYADAIADELRIAEYLERLEIGPAYLWWMRHTKAMHLTTWIGRAHAEPMLRSLVDEQLAPLTAATESALADAERALTPDGGSEDERAEADRFAERLYILRDVWRRALHAAETVESPIFFDDALREVETGAPDAYSSYAYLRSFLRERPDLIPRLEAIMLDLTTDRDLSHYMARALGPRLGFDPTELLEEMDEERARLHREGLWPPTEPFHPRSIPPRDDPDTPPDPD